MGKDSTGPEHSADLNDNVDEVKTKATSADDEAYTSDRKNKAASKLGKNGRVAPAARISREWLREIAKRAASTRWQRGD